LELSSPSGDRSVERVNYPEAKDFGVFLPKLIKCVKSEFNNRKKKIIEDMKGSGLSFELLDIDDDDSAKTI
jgi:hypothetical protein